jgi:glutaredoxin
MLKLYTKSYCPWCTVAIQWLREHDFDFEEINVSRDPDAFAELERISGQTMAPTLVDDDERVLPDFGPEELEGFLSGTS